MRDLHSVSARSRLGSAEKERRGCGLTGDWIGAGREGGCAAGGRRKEARKEGAPLGWLARMADGLAGAESSAGVGWIMDWGCRRSSSSAPPNQEGGSVGLAMRCLACPMPNVLAAGRQSAIDGYRWAAGPPLAAKRAPSFA